MDTEILMQSSTERDSSSLVVVLFFLKAFVIVVASTYYLHTFDQSARCSLCLFFRPLSALLLLRQATC